MAMKIGAITMDCVDPETLAAFWGELLGRKTGPGTDGDTYWAVRDPDPRSPLLLLQKVAEEKITKNRVHIDLWVADSESEAQRAVSLGATYVKRYGEPNEGWIWMTDPEGNEFCVCHADPENLD